VAVSGWSANVPIWPRRAVVHGWHTRHSAVHCCLFVCMSIYRLTYCSTGRVSDASTNSSSESYPTGVSGNCGILYSFCWLTSARTVLCSSTSHDFCSTSARYGLTLSMCTQNSRAFLDLCNITLTGPTTCTTRYGPLYLRHHFSCLRANFRGL